MNDLIFQNSDIEKIKIDSKFKIQNWKLSILYHILEKEKEKCYNDLMQKSNFELEKELYGRGYDFVIGVDEAGRGPLAGPVVAVVAAVRNFQIQNSKSQINSKIQNSKSQNTPSVLRTSPPRRGGEEWELIRDSKTLSEKQREEIYGFIMENFFVGTGICDHKTIDRMNVLQASFLAMKAALASLKSKIKNQNEKLQIKNQNFGAKNITHNTKCIILIDGDKKIPNFSGEQMAVPRGDEKIKSISAASIIAKVTRDRIMLEAHKKYSQYGFDRHKGYGTKLHMEALRKFGPCEIHRRSFKPIKSLVDNP